MPRYETSRGPGLDRRRRLLDEQGRARGGQEPPELRRRRHQKWEQSAAYIIDTHPAVEAFVKNAGLGFAIPYLHNGQPHDYVPDFIVRLKGEPRSPPDPGNQGLRRSRRGQGGGGRSAGLPR